MTMTNDLLAEVLAKLGPFPPWWRPFARRRWYERMCAALDAVESRRAWMRQLFDDVMAQQR